MYAKEKDVIMVVDVIITTIIVMKQDLFRFLRKKETADAIINNKTSVIKFHRGFSS